MKTSKSKMVFSATTLGYVVLALLYTTTNKLLIPANLQLATVCLILSLLFKAVLAVVVIHTPLSAVESKVGVVGFVMGGVGVTFPASFPLQLHKINKKKKKQFFISEFCKIMTLILFHYTN
jgi:hypothetical protein